MPELWSYSPQAGGLNLELMTFGGQPFHVGRIAGMAATEATSERLVVEDAGVRVTLLGNDFTYADGQLTGGTIWGFGWTLIDASRASGAHIGFSITNLPDIPVAVALDWVARDDNEAAWSTMFAGADQVLGDGGADVLRGFGGNDYMGGGLGPDTIFGGDGDDWIRGQSDRMGTPIMDPASQIPLENNYLRGDAGNDTIDGGVGFDDINGNIGDDLAHGGRGDDWVVGGKDQDQLYGDEGGDIVYGNLGNDTCDGGDGADIVRGGQGDDIVKGGAGNDWLSGDRGNDTITGGTGADVFHTFSGAGVDRVTDFSLAEGDRIQLDPGTTYALAQVGSDTVLDMGGGDQMILVGVSLSAQVQAAIFVG